MVNVELLCAAYRQRFSGASPAALVRAPGRVNLIGEHVDYNDGLVLPIAIERATHIAVGPSDRETFRIYSANVDQQVEFAVDDRSHPEKGRWDAYCRGVAAELARAGIKLAPANLCIESDVPVGAGLSSSAALEVATALALLFAAGTTLEAREVARICRLAEHHYAGVPCGIMDQFVCAMASPDAALLLDCRDQQIENIPWPAGDAVVVVVDSQCRHKLSDGTYAARVQECRRAVEQVRSASPSVQSLRDVSPEQLVAQRERMDGTTFRRAHHVIGEIQRTRDAAAALRAGDFQRFGRAMNASHDSLRDDYEVSSPQLDHLVEVVRGVPGVYGARMTGAGFGGCIVAVAERPAVHRVEAAVRQNYDPRHGVTAPVLTTRPCAGARLTRLTHP